MVAARTGPRRAAGRDRHGIPAVQPVAAQDGAGERHRGADHRQGRRPRRRNRRGRGVAGKHRPHRQARRVPVPPLRRPAAAGRDRPRAGHAAEADALRRSHLRPRPGAGGRGAGADGDARPGRHDHAGGHPRDRLRAGGERSHRVHRRGPDRGGGVVPRAPQQPEERAHPPFPSNGCCTTSARRERSAPRELERTAP